VLGDRILAGKTQIGPGTERPVRLGHSSESKEPGWQASGAVEEAI